MVLETRGKKNLEHLKDSIEAPVLPNNLQAVCEDTKNVYPQEGKQKNFSNTFMNMHILGSLGEFVKNIDWNLQEIKKTDGVKKKATQILGKMNPHKEDVL